MKKPKNDSSQDFNFNDGGMDEFFPMENPGQSGKPPKGVKGYLKNVAKSVFNLGVKVNKSLYPEAFSLGSNIKDIDLGSTASSASISQTIKSYADKVKNGVSEGVKIAKEITDDMKTAVKTGYFVKSENEDSGMDDMFNDMFGDDFDYKTADFGDDFDDVDSSSDDDSKKKRGRITASEATIRSSAASTKALLKSGRRQQAAIVGAAQSHIKHETQMFAQQLQLSQYQHRQKMLVMKNIANNLAKVINQNNIKLKAQMEYSAKSLAFTQDITALLKEIRAAQWSLVKPKKIDEINPSIKNKIFGSSGTSLDMNAWIKQIKKQFSYTSTGGSLSMFGSLKDGISMMTDMGMSKSQAIKQMIGSTLFDMGIQSLLTGKTRNNIELANMKMNGAGAAINRKLGDIADGKNETLNKISAWGTKKGGLTGDIVNKLIGAITGGARVAHINDHISYQSDRFIMGDPNKVHPFDNKAHKTLTEVIPAYLSKISAGVNHTEEETFDYKTNKFITKSSLKSMIAEKEKYAFDSIQNIGDFRSSFLNIATKSKSLSQADLEGQYNIMMKNFLQSGIGFTPESMREIKGKFTNGKFEPGLYSDQILAGTSFSTDEERFEACKAFCGHINRLRPNKKSTTEESMNWTAALTSMSSYVGNATSDMLELESERSMYGNSIDYQSAITSEKGYNSGKQRQLTKRLGYIDSRINTLKEKPRTEAITKELTKLITERQNIKTQLIDINRDAQYTTKNVNEDNFANIDNARASLAGSNLSEFDTFRISSLEDNSTHGLVQNIYNLLLSGIDVYTTPKENSSTERNKFLKTASSKISSNAKKAYDMKNDAKDNLKYESLGICPSDSEGLEKFKNQIPKNYIGKVYWKEDSAWKSEDCMKHSFIPGREYYLSYAEQKAHEIQYAQKERRKTNNESSENFYENSKNPFLRAFGGIKKGFNKIQDFKTGIINGILGNALYDEKNELLHSTSSKASNTLRERANKELNGRFQRIKIDKNFLSDVISHIDDKAFQSGLALCKGDVGKQAEYLIEQASKHKELQPYVQELSEIKQSASLTGTTKGAMSVIVNNIKNKLKTGVDRSLQPLARRLLNGKLASIKVGNKTLGAALTEIQDPVFHSVLAKEKDPIKKAKFIRMKIKTYPDILGPFDEKISEFVDNAQTTMSGPMGAALTVATDKMDKIKNRLLGTANNALNKFFKKRDVKRLMQLKVGDKTLSEVIKDDHALSNEVMMAFSRAEKIVESHTGFSLAPYGEELLKIKNSALDPFRSGIQSWIESVKDRIGNLGNKGADLADKMINKALDLVDRFITGKNRKTKDKNAIIGPELAKIKGLQEALQTVCDRTGQDAILRRAPNDFVRAGFIQKFMAENEELKPFLMEINEFINQKKADAKDNMSKLMSATGDVEDGDNWSTKTIKRAKKIGNKTNKMFNKAFTDGKSKINKAGELVETSGGMVGILGSGLHKISDVLTKHFKKDDKGSIDGDTAKEQRELKEAKRKRKEEEKAKREQSNFWKSILHHLKHGVHLDDKQQDKLLQEEGALMAAAASSAGNGGVLSNLIGVIKGPNRLKSAANLVKKVVNPKTIIAAGTIAGGVAGYKLAKDKGEQKAKEYRNYMLYKNQTEDNPAYGHADDAQQYADVFGSTGAVAGATSGYALTKIAGKGISKANSKILGKAAEFAQKHGHTKIADRLSAGAAKAAKNANSFGKGLPKNGAAMAKGVGKAANMAMGAFAGSTIANTIAKNMNLGETETKIVTGAGAVVGAAASNPLTKLLNILRKKVDKVLAKAIEAIIHALGKVITKIAPQIGGKMTALSGLAASGAGLLIPLATAVAAGADGMSENSTKQNFNLDKHSKVTMGMRIASGAYEAINSLTLGILGTIFDIIAATDNSILSGATSPAEWVYVMCGPKAEIAALERYTEFSSKRAIILGVKRQNLASWEARFQDDSTYGKVKNKVKSAVRSVGSWLAKGIAKVANMGGAHIDSDDIVRSNDQLASDMLGFAHVDIYKYWKSQKYDPCERIAMSICEQYGGVDKVFGMLMPSADELDSDGDGKADQNSEGFQAVSRQTDARVQILEKMRKYVLENKLAWLNSKLTLEDFEKYRAQSTNRIAAIAEEKKQKEDAANEKYKEISNIVTKQYGAGAMSKIPSSELAKIKAAADKAGVKADVDPKSNFNKFSNFLSKSISSVANWVKDKFKQYKFNEHEQNVMNEASGAIAMVHTKVDPTYYGKNEAAEISVGAESSSGDSTSGGIKFVGGNGGPESTSEGYFVKVKKVNTGRTVMESSTSASQRSSTSNDTSQANKQDPKAKTYDMSGKTPKSVVMNSIISDFAKDFGNELNKRLNILEEMHKENMRHNKVAEEFFTAALAMISQIAKNSGNSGMSSRLDAMISEIVR